MNECYGRRFFDFERRAEGCNRSGPSIGHHLSDAIRSPDLGALERLGRFGFTVGLPTASSILSGCLTLTIKCRHTANVYNQLLTTAIHDCAREDTSDFFENFLIVCV